MAGKKFPLIQQSPSSLCLLATVILLPWTKSFNFESAHGRFCFEVLGCWWLVFVFVFNFDVCACVCIVLRLHI